MHPKRATERPVGGTGPHLRAGCGNKAALPQPRGEQSSDLVEDGSEAALLQKMRMLHCNAGRLKTRQAAVKRCGRCSPRNCQTARLICKVYGKRGINALSRTRHET